MFLSLARLKQKIINTKKCHPEQSEGSLFNIHIKKWKKFKLPKKVIKD